MREKQLRRSFVKSSFEGSMDYSVKIQEKENEKPGPETNCLNCKKDDLREFRLNLADEYCSHMRNMSLLDKFKDLKFSLDHGFFKSIILPRSNGKNVSLQPDSNDFEAIIRQDLDSIIDP